jgi:hypothetical protein
MGFHREKKSSVPISDHRILEETDVEYFRNSMLMCTWTYPRFTFFEEKTWMHEDFYLVGTLRLDPSSLHSPFWLQRREINLETHRNQSQTQQGSTLKDALARAV